MECELQKPPVRPLPHGRGSVTAARENQRSPGLLQAPLKSGAPPREAKVPSGPSAVQPQAIARSRTRAGAPFSRSLSAALRSTPVRSAPLPSRPLRAAGDRSAPLSLSSEKFPIAVLKRLPALTGAPIRIETSPGLRDRRGAVHAGSFLRQRRIALNCTRAEFPRILVHELFHFVWLRAGNPLRQSWEALLKSELAAHARGELGWSAEWRKQALQAIDVQRRSRRWREYCCESFCDTAAWRYSGVRRHAEFTLAARFRAHRRGWFETAVGDRQLPV